MDEENTCKGCEFYDEEEDYCGYFDCFMGCEEPLPCEDDGHQ